ncbi:MAG: carboxyl transferase domain-containing protein, partial [Ignavibacteria bacterium]
GAVEIIFKREIEKSLSPAEELNKKLNEYIEKFANPYIASEKGYIDSVIFPHETRRKLINSFTLLKTKADKNPKKKHGNIPL